MSDFIGFLIVLFIFLFPFLVQFLNKKKQKEMETEIKPIIKKSPRKVIPKHFIERKKNSDFEFRSELDDFKQENQIEKRQIDTNVSPDVAIKAEKKFAYGNGAKKKLQKRKKISLKKMIIYSEIYDSTKFS